MPDSELVERGCCCARGGGMVHLACIAREAAALAGTSPASGGYKASWSAWRECSTCSKPYSGAVLLGLARAWRVKAGDECGFRKKDAAKHTSTCDRLAALSASTSAGEKKKKKKLAAKSGAARKKAAVAQATEALMTYKSAQLQCISRLVMKHTSLQQSAAEENLAAVCSEQGMFADAERLQLENLAVARRALGNNHPHRAAAAAALAHACTGLGMHFEAEELQLDALASRTRALGDVHPDTLAAAAGLGDVLLLRGKYADAEELLTTTLGLMTATLGACHSGYLGTATTMAQVSSRAETRARAKKNIHTRTHTHAHARTRTRTHAHATHTPRADACPIPGL